MKQTVDGVEYNVREETFQTVKEDWAEYTMSSGVKVRLKINVTKMFRILDADGNPAFTDNGDPNIIVRRGITIVASS